MLDGAAQTCRDISMSAASSDSRIKVLDLPKDDARGARNVDFAISKSLSHRIFYIDDDDLWRPQHIAELGRYLEDCDVVDSRVCSVDRHGGLNLGACRGSNRRMRELLANARLKSIYDTHIGHRRDAYGRLSSWVTGNVSGDRVWNFLAGFAGHHECRWASYDGVTALSLHGSARADVAPQVRQEEITVWSRQLGDIESRVSQAGSLFHLFRLLQRDSPDLGCGFDEYLEVRGAYSDVTSGYLAKELFGLFASAPPAEPDAVVLAIKLSEPVEAGYIFEHIAAKYFQAYGQEVHERILCEVASREGHNRAARLAAYSAALVRRDLGEACEVARSALALGPDPVRTLAKWYDRLSGTAAE